MSWKKVFGIAWAILFILSLPFTLLGLAFSSMCLDGSGCGIGLMVSLTAALGIGAFAGILEKSLGLPSIATITLVLIPIIPLVLYILEMM